MRENKREYCVGCYYCTEHNGKCFKKDGSNDILDKIIKSDILVFATPIYFYNINAQLKLFLVEQLQDIQK